MRELPLTGKTRFRCIPLSLCPDQQSLLVLQVEYITMVILEDPASGTQISAKVPHWRDASVQDLGELTSLSFAEAPRVTIQNASPEEVTLTPAEGPAGKGH